MPKILFTERCEVARQDGRGRVFEAGEVHDLPHASVRHWTERGKGTTDRVAIAAAEAVAGVAALGGGADGGLLVAPEVRSAFDRDAAEMLKTPVIEAAAPRTTAPAAAHENVVLPASAVVTIPADWRGLPWPALKSLASKVAPETAIKTKADAEAAVEAELARRAGA
jgi:hypothetical protein